MSVKENVYLNGRLIKSNTSPLAHGFVTHFLEPVQVNKDDIMTVEMEFFNTQLGIPHETKELPKSLEPFSSRPKPARPVPSRVKFRNDV